MLTPTDDLCFAMLEAASASPFGVILATTNPTRARQAIYRFRQELGDPTYAELQVRVSPYDSEGQILLVKRDVVNAYLTSNPNA